MSFSRNRRPLSGDTLERTTRLDRRRQSAFIEIVEFTADGHAMGEARDIDVCAFEAVGDVVRRGLAVHRRVTAITISLTSGAAARSTRLAMFRSSGPTPSQRRQGAAENMVLALMAAARSSAQRSPTSSTTQMTEGSREVSAQMVQGSHVSTLPQLVQITTCSSTSDMAAVTGEPGFLALDQVENGPARRSRPQARHFGHELDQPLDFRPCSSARHNLGPRDRGSCPAAEASRPVTSFIFSATACSILLRASAWAATIRSSRISPSSSLRSEGSIFMPRMAPLPLNVTVTRRRRYALDFEIFEGGLHVGHLGLKLLRLLHKPPRSLIISVFLTSVVSVTAGRACAPGSWLLVILIRSAVNRIDHVAGVECLLDREGFQRPEGLQRRVDHRVTARLARSAASRSLACSKMVFSPSSWDKDTIQRLPVHSLSRCVRSLTILGGMPSARLISI